MIIGIDAREGAKQYRAGKGEYVYQLVSQLITHQEHRFILFLDTDPPAKWQQANVKCIVYRMGALGWQLAVFWYLELCRPVDVYLSTTSLILPALVRSVPVVTAVMDFVSFLFADQHDKKAVLLERWWMRWALRYSRRLIAISENTKQDAVRLFKINPRKITVTPLAASFIEAEEPCPLPYSQIILCVGTLEPRKNLERVVAAFNQIKTELPQATLVLMGRWGWSSEGIRSATLASPFCRDIHVLTDVTDAQKKDVYRQAQVLAFPSLYEGFGLPPLEAMTLGIPVVASWTSSVPEVVGEAGILVDPLSVEAIAAAIKQVLTDQTTAQSLRDKGFKRAQLFNWQTTAAATLKVLQTIGE